MRGTKHQSAESKYPSIRSNEQREHSLKQTEFKSNKPSIEVQNQRKDELSFIVMKIKHTHSTRPLPMLLVQDNISMLFLSRGTLFSPNGLANHLGATVENRNGTINTAKTKE
jgi:hypothetical protein